MNRRRVTLTATQLGELSAAIGAILDGKAVSGEVAEYLRHQTGPVCGELRHKGQLLAAHVKTAANQWDSLCSLLESSGPAINQADQLLLCLCGPPEPVSIHEAAGWRGFIANIRRGTLAYKFQSNHDPNQILFISPFAVVAQNRTLQAMLDNFAQRHGLTLELAKAGKITVHSFKNQQFRIDLHRREAPAEELFRATRLVPLAEITRPNLERLSQRLGEFLAKSVQPDGRMVYLYYPSRGAEDLTKNNAIRQWMATRALIRVWQRSPSDELLAIPHKNLDFNLQAMYHEEGGLGLIFDGQKVKLGAVALAALALAESPFESQHTEIYGRLLATTQALWMDNGQFRTFYRPQDRTDCQNFYPGEALLLWSAEIRNAKDARLPRRFWKSFAYYQEWHQTHRNPAFIPWHTQAYFSTWKIDQNPRLAEAIFEMNDWLLSVQQWETAPGPDCRGRFYDPHRPFGPPHASSTAVYLEGLADALALARELKDEHRSSCYRLAILRGLRSIAQLMFKDEGDMFYVTKRGQLRGGVRTTEYNNAVRIDNVQHSLTAIHKVLDVFVDADFS